MKNAYESLREKVDAFAALVHSRRAADLACAPGCSSCCEVHLTVSGAEARRIATHLATRSPERRAELAARARGIEGRTSCVMLDDDGRCAIYAARPLVCRSQGLALRYPEGFVPLEAVQMRLRGAPVTWCPLNFQKSPPASEDILDAERVDTTLALVNRLEAEARSEDPERRFALAELVLVPGPMEAPTDAW